MHLSCDPGYSIEAGLFKSTDEPDVEKSKVISLSPIRKALSS